MNGDQAGVGGASDLTALPPVAPLEPMSTKPRQIPGGEASSPEGPQMPLLPGQQPEGGGSPLVGGGDLPPVPGQFDPAASGLDQQGATPQNQPEDDAPKTAHRFVAVLSDVRQDNPGLPFREATVIAQRAMALLQAEQDDPLAVMTP